MGKIILCRIGEEPDADIKLLITRVPKQLRGWLHVPELAPSPGLFFKAQKWKKEGLWPQKWPEYKSEFLKEMTLPVADKFLDRLVLRIREGKTIALSCFCVDEIYCHRSLVKWVVIQKIGAGDICS